MHPSIKILPNYTYEDYCLWEGRWEVLDGIPYAMSPAPVPRHQLISATLVAEFVYGIRKANCKKCNVYNSIDFIVEENTILQPDILVVCKPIEKKFLDFSPVLVVEILSPSTAMKDRNNKFSIYQKQQIPYYIIIDAEKKELEIYHLINGKYEIVSLNEEAPYTFSFSDECSVAIKLSQIWN